MTRRRLPVKAEINLVPYIDVVLVLLVIFMMVAPLSPVSQIPLPQVRADAVPSQYVQLHIQRTSPTPHYVLTAVNGSRERNIGEYDDLNTLLTVLKGEPGSTAVLIAAAADSRYEDVLKVLSAVKQEGWSKVGLATR